MKKTTPSKGDTVKVKSGPYKGLKSTIQGRSCPVYDSSANVSKQAWIVIVHDKLWSILTVVFEDEF